MNALMQRYTVTSTAIPSKTKNWLVFLLAAFMWMQFAGTIHKLIHADHAGHAVPAATSHQALEKFFPAHSKQNKQDCQLLDLQCADAAPVLVLPPIAPPVFELQIVRFAAAVLAAQLTLAYRSRAPPALI